MDVREEHSMSNGSHPTRESVIRTAILSVGMALGMSVAIHLLLTRILGFPPSGSLMFLSVCNAIILASIGFGAAQGLRKLGGSSPMSTATLRRIGFAFALSGIAVLLAVLALARESFVVGITLALVAMAVAWRAAGILREEP